MYVLTVFSPDEPRLLSVIPGNTSVTQYEDVSLGAVVEGNPAPHVAWVSQKGSVLQNKTEGFNYTITSITQKETGRYMCIATNSLGSHRREFVISVKGKRPETKCCCPDYLFV